LKSILSTYVFSTLTMQRETLLSGWIEADENSLADLAAFLE